MPPAWAQRQAELLRDGIVSPDVFQPLGDRLHDCAVPYPHVLETAASQCNVPLSLAGLWSHLHRQNAETIAAVVEVERLVLQGVIGTASWDHRPLVHVWVGPVVEPGGAPAGLIAFDPSSCPQRGPHAVGVKRQWWSPRGKIDHCQGGVFLGYVSRHAHAWLDCRLSRPQDWARAEPQRAACHVPPAVRSHTRHAPCLELLAAWGAPVPQGWGTGDDALGRHPGVRRPWRHRGEGAGLGGPGPTTVRALEAPAPA